MSESINSPEMVKPGSESAGSLPMIPAVSPVDPSAGGQDDAGAVVSDDTAKITPATKVLLDSNNPDVAEDADVIEKSWVKRAKDIVNDTHDDPRKQKEALSEFKADYMKKRFDKDIKTEKD